MTSIHDSIRLGDSSVQLDIRDEERLAFDVHDGPSQAITAITLLVRNHLERFEVADGTLDLLTQVLELAAEGKRQLDEISEGILLEPVDDGGLVPALRQLVDAMTGRGPVVDLHVSGVPAQLSPDVERALFRVAEGSLVNAWRHGACRRARIDLRFGPARVVLRVADDGCGVGPAGLVEGTGMRGMRRRVEAVGGWVRVMGGATSGLLVEAAIPKEAR